MIEMACNILITNLTEADEISNAVTHRDTRADKVIVLSSKPVEISEIGQIPVEHIEMDESFEGFIKIITPLFKENKEYCTIIKPDVFGLYLLWSICEFRTINPVKIYPEMTQLPIIKGRFFGAKKKNIMNWIKENPGIEKRLVVEEFKKHTKKQSEGPLYQHIQDLRSMGLIEEKNKNELYVTSLGSDFIELIN